MKGTVVVVLLWVIAIVTTLLVVGDPADFAVLGPVYAICMIGSVVTVRNLERSKSA